MNVDAVNRFRYRLCSAYGQCERGFGNIKVRNCVIDVLIQIRDILRLESYAFAVYPLFKRGAGNVRQRTHLRIFRPYVRVAVFDIAARQNISAIGAFRDIVQYIIIYVMRIRRFYRRVAFYLHCLRRFVRQFARSKIRGNEIHTRFLVDKSVVITLFNVGLETDCAIPNTHGSAVEHFNVRRYRRLCRGSRFRGHIRYAQS